MRTAQRFQFRYGPYRTPRFHYGSVVMDQARGEVRIVRLSSARVLWPVGRRGGHDSLVLFAAIEKAVRHESNQAVAY